MVSSIFTAFLVGYAVSVIARVNFLIESVGWKATFLMLGILFGLVVGVATLLLRPPPRRMEVTGKRSMVPLAVIGILRHRRLHVVPHLAERDLAIVLLPGAGGVVAGMMKQIAARTEGL